MAGFSGMQKSLVYHDKSLNLTPFHIVSRIVDGIADSMNGLAVTELSNGTRIINVFRYVLRV